MHHTDGFSKEEDDWELLDDEELIRSGPGSWGLLSQNLDPKGHLTV